MNTVYRPEYDYYNKKELSELLDLEKRFLSVPIKHLKIRIKVNDIEDLKNCFEKNHSLGFRKRPSFDEPWDKEKHPDGKQSTWYVPLWKTMSIYENEKYKNWFGTGTIETKYIDTGDRFKEIYEQILSLLPYREIFFLRIWSNKQPIGPHRDQDWLFNMPTSFRCMLYDENQYYDDNKSFFVTDQQKIQKYYYQKNKIGNVFCFNNGGYLHGSDYKEGSTKMLLVMTGILDAGKLETLLTDTID